MKYSLSKERKSQIDRYCRITSAIEKNFVPLKLVDINYDSEINIFDLLLLSDFLQDI